jgi:hypothetical protein
MYSPGVVLIFFDLTGKVSSLLLTFMYLAQDAIEVSSYLIDST